MKLEKEVYIGNVEWHNLYIGNEIHRKNVSFEIFSNKINNKEFEILRKLQNNYKVKLTLEVQEPILDEKERKYLSGVIRPFRDEIECIIKRKSIDYENKEYIIIHYEQLKTMPFPYFEKSTMYKGMELNKEYTLEELQL